jgi:hypothetical protein
MGSDNPRSRLAEKRGTLESVGVGGVFTIIGAGSPGGGVEGEGVVEIDWIFADRGRSGEDVLEADCGDCLSGNIEPILDATLPRLLLVNACFSFSGETSTAPPFCSLVFGLDRRRFKVSFIRPTGEGVRF